MRILDSGRRLANREFNERKIGAFEGMADHPSEQEFREAPAIGKPFSVDQLSEKLRTLLLYPKL